MTEARILVVEDESIVAKDIQHRLTRLGYDVPAVIFSGEQVIEKATEIQPDLVLMDIKLKGDLDGTEAAEQIRSRFDIPVVFLTAYADDETLERAKLTEPFGYVIKPFEERELYSTIEMALYKHRAERELRASEARLRAIFESAMDGMFVIDRHGHYVDVNPAGCRMLGYAREEILGSEVRLLFFPEDIERSDSMMPDFFGEAGRSISEFRLRRKDDAEIWVEMTVAPFAVGAEELVLCVKRNVTDRKRAEESLRESELRHRTLLEAATDAVFLETLEGDVLDCNTATCEMFGYTKEELIGLNVADLVPEEVVQTLPDIIAEELATGSVLVEASQKRKDGTVFPAEVSTRAITLGEKKLVVAYVHDLTGRRQVEEELRQRAIQMALLNDISGKIAAVLELGSLLERAARLVQRGFGYHHVALFILDRAQDELVMKAIAGAFEHLFPPDHRLKLDQGIVGWVGLHGEKLVVNDVSSEPRYINFFPDAMPTRSELSVPIRVGGEILGVLDVQSPQVNAFSENEVMLMETLADQMAVAIDNARLYEAIQEELIERERVEEEIRWRAEMLAALHETALDLAAQRSLPDLLQAIASRAVNLLKARGAGIYLYRSASDDLELVVSDDPRSDFIGDVLQRGQGLSGKVLETGRPMVVDDYSRWEGRTSQHDRGHFTASVAIPIFWGDRLLGMLSMVDNAPRTFSSDDIALLERFTPLVGAALGQTQLLEEAQARWREAETLRQAGAAVTETLSLDETLAQILEQLERVVPYDSASLLLRREGYLEILSGRGHPDVDAVIGLKFPVPGDNPNTRVIEGRRPLILPDAQAAHSDFHESPHDRIRSWLGVPLIFHDQVIGMLTLDSFETGYFKEEHVRLVTPFANQAAIAIENARLVEGLEAEVAARMAEIVAEREKSETILRCVGDAIGMADLQMRVQYVNEAFTALTGYTAEEAKEQLGNFLVAERLPEQDWQALQHALARGEVWRGEATFERKDGRTYDAAVTVSPMRDAEGKLVGYVSSHEDVSRFKELDRARSRFMTNVSHELRTPVANMKLYTQLLRRSRQPERNEHYLQVLEGQVDRLGALIKDILEMTALTGGRAIMNWGPVSLFTVVGDVVTRFTSRAQVADLTLVAAPVPPGLPTVQGDQARLTQALVELVENATIFTPAGGQVAVEVGEAEEEGQRWVTITVRDTGPGIPPQEQECVFDEFFRGSLAESGHIPGTGLGLSIVQEIMRAHGGQVTVESEVGQGSIFTLWLRGEA